MKAYDHKRIEAKWQKKWAEDHLYETPDAIKGRDNFYLLVEFPYPSGNLHVGHWYAFAVPDMLARYLRMKGNNVLYPIGFDAFGLPAENAAIKNKLNPRVWTEQNIAYMKKQIGSMGTSFDLSRMVSTIDPAYYKWTQWQFLQFFKKGLAYQKETPVNWCPSCKTVLANEQVVDGACERCGSEVIQKLMLQWNIKITEYADRLIDDLKDLNWPEEIKESQRNWIGRSEGAELYFPIKFEGHDAKKPNFLLLHGKSGSSNSACLPWLKKQLEGRGYAVQVPDLPDAEEPNDERQADYVEKHCTIAENTVILGHSFGGIVALRLVERGHKPSMLVLAGMPFSGVYRDGKDRPTVTAALKKGFNFETIKQNTNTVLLYDAEDYVVPPADGEQLKKALGGQLFTVKAEKSHFTGETESWVLAAADPTITVFTTRPDTLFGATYLVLSPEHLWVTLALKHPARSGKTVLKNSDEVQAYVEKAGKKTERERLENKNKTGVKLEGVYAINPASGERIPMYVADYVLGHYGTGAIMAVPAHDERDFEFAQRFDISIKQVVAPVVHVTKGGDAVRPDVPFKERDAVMAIVKHWEKDEFLCIEWKKFGDIKTFISGGIEDGENVVAAGVREIREESGYQNPVFIRDVGQVQYVEFYHQAKETNVRAKMHYLYFELKDGARTSLSDEEDNKHSVVWKTRSDVRAFLSINDIAQIWDQLQHGNKAYVGDGVLINSSGFDGLSIPEAKKKITELYGSSKKTYKLRDWIVSRQRYWGVPIPIVHCEKCGPVAVPDEQLPVLLPEVEDYLPSGEGKSPLAKVDAFVDVKCPQCGGIGKRETDTLDTFVDSSWYFLRYTDPHNSKAFAAKDKQDNWMPVDLYSGGAEHTTMHVLYSRFWHKALFDLGLVDDPEPYTRRMNRSIILGPDGQKMSKSRGNVIDPDAEVERLGADTVRMYLAFIGPYNEVGSYPWNPDGVVGVRRFLERLWRAQECVRKEDVEALDTLLHKTIKKVGDDAAHMKFNTAISQLMIFLNALEKEKRIGEGQWSRFLTLVAPFAPHMAEELWGATGEKDSVHRESWPNFDPKFLVDTEVTIAIQIDGKTRGDVVVAAGADKAEVERLAREVVAARLKGVRIARTIIVPNRLINFVLER